MELFQAVEASVGHRLLAPRIGYLIGTNGTRGSNLIPVSNLTSVSKYRQLIVVAVYKQWDTYHNLLGAEGFTVSVPTTDQIDIVWRLASKYSGFAPPDGSSKLEACGGDIDTTSSKFGPILEGGVGWLECRMVEQAAVESDHGIFFAEVVRAFFNPEFLTTEGLYKKNSRPVMQVVKNYFATSTDQWQIPFFKE